MRQGRTIQEHAAELARAGRDNHARAYPWHVLVGVGVLGEAGDLKKVPRRGTLIINIDEAMGSLAGSLAGRVWHIRRDPQGPREVGITLGRHVNNDVVIPDYSISEHHCDFLEHADGLSLVDRGALNGTRVGRDRLPPNMPWRLRDQDLVTLGRFEFQFLLAMTFLANVERLASAG